VGYLADGTGRIGDPSIPDDVGRDFSFRVRGVSSIDVSAEIIVTPHDQSCARSKNRPVGISVAILGSAELDVNAIDYSTLSFDGLALDGVGLSDGTCAVEYVNEDDVLDVVCTFTTGDILAELTGELADGTSLVGVGSVCLK